MNDCPNCEQLNRICEVVQSYICIARRYDPGMSEEGMKEEFQERIQAMSPNDPEANHKERVLLDLAWPIAWKRILESDANN